MNFDRIEFHEINRERAQLYLPVTLPSPEANDTSVAASVFAFALSLATLPFAASLCFKNLKISPLIIGAECMLIIVTGCCMLRACQKTSNIGQEIILPENL